MFRDWITKTIKFVIPLLILTCCTKTVNYENIMQKQTKMLSTDVIVQLEKEKVIINDSDFIFVDTTVIEGVHVSNVIISDSIVSNAEKRFIIAHLIRNLLIDGAIIYNYDEDGNNFTMKPYIEVSSDFIKIEMLFVMLFIILFIKIILIFMERRKESVMNSFYRLY